MAELDFSTKFGRRVRQRLRQELILWLITVDAQGTPQTRPIWFHWDGETALIYSKPTAAKLRHIAANPRVGLNFNSDEGGDDFAVFTGQAERLPGDAPEARVKAYLRKYRAGIRGLDMTPKKFFEEYSVPIVVRPETMRGW